MPARQAGRQSRTIMSALREDGKSAAAFRTISEVSRELDIPQHVLRFWETKFSQVRPLKRGGGRRYYRPEDIELLRRIQGLLYDDGYTIKGVQRLLREGRKRPPAAEAAAAETTETPGEADVGAEAAAMEPPPPRLPEEARVRLEALLAELKELRSMLQGE